MIDDNQQVVAETAEAAAPGRARVRLRPWFFRAAERRPPDAALAIGGKVYLDRVEARALRLAQTGTTLNTFLKSYVDLLRPATSRALLALYDENYSHDRDGPWEERLQSDRDRVQVYAWTANVSGRSRGMIYASKRNGTSAGSVRSSPASSRSLRSSRWRRRFGRDPGGPLAPRQHAGPESSRELDHPRLRSGPTDPAGRSGTGIGRRPHRGRTGSRFTDVTQESGITFESGHNPMLNEPEWFPKKFGIMKYATAGVTAADYDNDGWCDIFFCDGANPALPEQARRHVRGRPRPRACRVT